MKRKVFFRADGSDKIGLGHVIRSCALAHMLKDDFECHFFIRNPLPALKKEILQACSFIHELSGETDYLTEAAIWQTTLNGNEIVVLDGYNFDTAYQRMIKESACKLVCIDDIHAFHFIADVVINHAGGISPDDYDAKPGVEFCLGPAYALLREPFLKAAKQRHDDDVELHNILICMGGADPKNDTLSMLSLALEHEELEQIFVVIGAAYRHEPSLQSYIAQSSRSIHLLKGIGPDEMAMTMRRCGTAICPPSSIAFEYLSIGGLLYLHEIADNQKDIRRYFINGGLAFEIRQFGKIDNALRAASFNYQRAIFDGRSDQRILEAFKKI